MSLSALSGLSGLGGFNTGPSFIYLLQDEFNTPSGRLADMHGSYVLVNTNGTTFTPGLVGDAATFVAASSQKLVAPSFPTVPAGTSFTLTGWVKFNTTGLQRLWGLGTPGSGGCSVFTRANQVEISFFDGVSVSPSPVKAYTQATGTWYFVSVTYDAANDILSLDLNASGTPGTASRTDVVGADQPFNIGESGSGFGYLDGQADSIGYWQRALSASEIAAIYNSGAGRSYASLTTADKVGLISWYDFSDLTSPRTSEPGPGTLTLVQLDGLFSIVGGKVAIPAQVTPALGDLGMYGSALSRVAGRALMATVNRVNTTSIGPYLGWQAVANVNNNQLSSRAIYFQTAGSMSTVAGTVLATGATYSAGVDQELAVILRSAGAFLLCRPTGGTWTLAWVDNAGSDATVYPAFSCYDGVSTLDSLRVTDLPAPWNTNYGIATDRKAGAVADGTTFAHAANCILEFTITTFPSSSNGLIHFRKQDANNYWRINFTSGGVISLDEIVAGVGFGRAGATPGTTAGQRILVIANGSTISGYSDGALLWTYSSASNFQTMTAGSMISAGPGAVVSDLIAWPRTISLPAGV
jgi:hypothetical protein